MRHNKVIEQLAGTQVALPKHDFSFGSYREKLARLVSDNFGGKLAYDDYEQVFCFELSETLLELADRADAPNPNIVSVRRTFTIDPTKGLVLEFARLEKETADFAEYRRKVSRALAQVQP